MLAVAQWLAPMLSLALAVALLTHTAQGGFVFATEALQPNWGGSIPRATSARYLLHAGLSRLLRSLVPFAPS